MGLGDVVLDGIVNLGEGDWGLEGELEPVCQKGEKGEMSELNAVEELEWKLGEGTKFGGQFRRDAVEGGVSTMLVVDVCT